MIFKHSYSILKHNALRTFLFVVLYGFCMFAICFIPTIFDAQYITEMNKNLQEYGKMNAVICDLNKAELDEMNSSFSILSYQKGFVEKYGDTSFNGVSAVIGHLDSRALDLGNIKAIEGKLPSNKNEIAVEKKIAGSASVGDTVSLNINGHSYSFKLTGIVKDYAKDLMYSLPNIIVGGKLDEQISKYDMMVYFRWALSYRETGSLRFPENVITASSLPHSRVQYNYHVYSVRRPYAYDANQTFLMVGIFATIVFVVFIIFSNFLNNLERVIYDLRLFGATGGYIAWLKIVISVMTLVLSIMVYFVIYYIIISITEHVLGVRIYLLNSITSQVLFGSMVLFPMFLLIYSVRNSLAKGLKPISFSDIKEEKFAGRTIELKGSLDLNFAKTRMKYRRLKLFMFGVVLAIFVAVILVMTEDVDSKILYNTIGRDRTITPGRVEPSQEEIFNADGFIYTEKTGGTPYEETLPIWDYEEITARNEFNALYPSLIVKASSGSEYAKRMFEKTDGSQSEEFVSGSTWVTPYTEKNFRIFEIDDNVYGLLSKIFRHNEPDKVIENGKALAILNGFETGVEDEDGKMIYLLNDLYKDGDMMIFGWVTSDAGIDEVRKDPSLLEHHTESFEIMATYDGSVYTRALFDEFNDVSILIFIPQKTVRESELMSLVSKTDITFSSFTRLGQYRSFDKEYLEPYTEKYPFLRVNYTDDETIRDVSLQIQTLTFVKDMLVACEVILVMFAIINIVFEKYKEFEKMFMTMRSIGYRTWHIISTIFMEYFGYYVIELLVIMFFDIVLCMIYLPNLYSFPLRTTMITKFRFYCTFAITNTSDYAILLSGLVIAVTLVITLTTIFKKLVNFIRMKE